MSGKTIIIRSLSIISALLIVMLGYPCSQVKAEGLPVVSLGAYSKTDSMGNPFYVTKVPTNGDFVVRLNVSQVSDFKAYQFQLNYNSSVIQVTGAESGGLGVTAGLIGSSVVPVDNWTYFPTGTQGAVRVLGRIPAGLGSTGPGYLAEVHFSVIGASDQTSVITPTDVPSGSWPFYNGLFNSLTNKISTVTPWSGISVQVFPALQIANTSLGSGEVGLTFSQTLVATGGYEPYTWSIKADTMPPGLSLNASNGAITGTPTTSGDFNVNVTVTDNFSPANSFSKILAMHVYDAISISSTSLPDGSRGSAYSTSLATAGGKAPYTWLATGLPTGLTVYDNGTIAGTPTASGDFSVQVTVKDAFGLLSAVSKILVLHIFNSIAITNNSLPDGSQGVAYSTSLSTTGGKDPYTWLASGLPTGLSISDNGTISGTPTVSGDFSVQVVVSDTLVPPNQTTKTLALHIFAPVSISTLSLSDGTQGVAYSTSLAATGGKVPYTWTAVNLPSGLSVFDNGTITGTPAVSGAFNVTVSATDTFSPSNKGSRTMVLNIYSPVSIVTNSLPDGSQGVAYSTNLAASGGKIPYIWNVTGLPSGLVTSQSGAISGIPTVSGNFTANVNVMDSSNPSNSVNTTLNLYIYPALQIPSQSLLNGEVGLNYSQNLAVSGGKSPFSWSVLSGNPPNGLSLSPSGIIVGVPTTAAVPDNFTVKVVDSMSVSATRVISITVLKAASITTTSLPDGEVGIDYSKTLISADGTLPYIWSASGLPAGLTISTSGLISGKPGGAGDFDVVLTLTDSYNPPCIVNRTLSLKIYDTAQIVTTSLLEVLQNKTCSQTLVASGGNTAYNWSATGLPAGLSMSAAGVISGTPTVWGSFIVNIALTDSLRGTNSVNKSLTLKVYMPYDSNGNGMIDMGDVVKVERIILRFDPDNPAADSNGDGKVDAGDIVKLERVILKIDP